MSLRRPLAMVFLGVMLVTANAEAQPTQGRPASAVTANRPRTAQSPWQWTVELGREHDDNVLQLTRSGLDRFAIRPGPPRFLISDVGDWATTGDAAIRWNGKILRRRDTRLSATGSFQRWDRDRVANWQQYGLGLNQELTSSRRNLTSAQLWLKHIPRYYLGEVTDLNASVIAGQRVRASLTYAQTAYGVALHQDVMGGRISGTASLERVHRNYNPNFPERDNDNDQVELGLQVKPLRRNGPTLGVSWIKGDLNAAGDLPDTLFIRDQDISYDHHGVGASLSQAWAYDILRGRLDASILREDRRYLTTDVFDVNRYSRTNIRREAQVRITERLTASTDVILNWSRLSSEATYEVLSLVEPSTTDFVQEKFAVSLRTRW